MSGPFWIAFRTYKIRLRLSARSVLTGRLGVGTILSPILKTCLPYGTGQYDVSWGDKSFSAPVRCLWRERGTSNFSGTSWIARGCGTEWVHSTTLLRPLFTNFLFRYSWDRKWGYRCKICTVHTPFVSCPTRSRKGGNRQRRDIAICDIIIDTSYKTQIKAEFT